MCIVAHEDWLLGTCNLQYMCDACTFFLFHSITVNPAFECSEQNHHSDFVQFPPAVTEDCFKLYKEKTGLIFFTSQDLYYKTI